MKVVPILLYLVYYAEILDYEKNNPTSYLVHWSIVN